MRYLADQAMWLLPSPPGAAIEVLVAGTPTAVDESLAALVAQGLTQLDRLRADAVAYFAAFVATETLADGDDWCLEGIEASRSQDRKDQLTLIFSRPGDVYGEWSVSFQVSSQRLFPIAFARHQR